MNHIDYIQPIIDNKNFTQMPIPMEFVCSISIKVLCIFIYVYYAYFYHGQTDDNVVSNLITSEKDINLDRIYTPNLKNFIFNAIVV